MLTQTRKIGLVWGAIEGIVFAVAGFSGILFPDFHMGRYCVLDVLGVGCVDRLNFYGYYVGPGAILIIWGILVASVIVGFRSAVETAIGALLMSQIAALLIASSILSVPQSPLFDLTFPVIAVSYSLLFMEIFAGGIFGCLLGLVLRAGIRRIIGESLGPLEQRQ